MIPKTWDDFYSRLEQIEFEDFDLIVAIGRGGIIPASLIQRKLNIPMNIININYRDDSHIPKYEEAKILEKKEFETKDKRILLVDDVSKTGETLQKAKDFLKDNKVKTCVINGMSDYSFFNSEVCLRMPWMR